MNGDEENLINVSIVFTFLEFITKKHGTIPICPHLSIPHPSHAEAFLFDFSSFLGLRKNRWEKEQWVVKTTCESEASGVRGGRKYPRGLNMETVDEAKKEEEKRNNKNHLNDDEKVRVYLWIHKKMRKVSDTEPSPLSSRKGFDAYYFKTENFPSRNDKNGNNFARLHGRSLSPTHNSVSSWKILGSVNKLNDTK